MGEVVWNVLDVGRVKIVMVGKEEWSERGGVWGEFVDEWWG